MFGANYCGQIYLGQTYPTYGGAGDVTVVATVQTSTFSLPAVTIVAIQNITVLPSALSGTFSLPVVSEIISVTIVPSSFAGTFSTQTPSISGGATAFPIAVSGSFSIPSYGVVVDVTVSVSAQGATFSLPASSIQIGAVASAGFLSATFSLPASTVLTGDATVYATALSGVFALQSPTIAIDALASPAVQAFSGTTGIVSVRTDVIVTPSAIGMITILPAVWLIQRQRFFSGLG